VKTLAVLILISAILVAAWAVLIRPKQHPMMIDASYMQSPLVAPCPVTSIPLAPNPLKPKTEADA
jgi:hypothetical protein